MRNIAKKNLRTCIHLTRKEFEEIIRKTYPEAEIETDYDTPSLLNVYPKNENCLNYDDILETVTEYFDTNIISIHAETSMDGEYDVWLEYQK